MNTKLFIFTGLVGCFAALGTVACGDSGTTSTSTGGGGTGGSGTGGSTTTMSSTGGNGSGGGTTTGSAATCTAYCTTIMAACSGANAQYTTMDGCLKECGAFDQGTAGAMSGDNLECRTYHAGVAATADAAIHCVHAGPLGSGADAAGAGCTSDHLSRCAAYCAINQEVCGVTAYATADECNTACMAETDDADFNTGITSGANMECRMYHMSVAAQDADSATAHCPHTKFDESTQCQ